MSINMACNIEGATEFCNAVQKLDRNMQGNVQAKLQEWGEQVKASAQRFAPARTGYLRTTLYVKTLGWTAEIGAEAAYAAYVEFGTRNAGARPYLLPALEQHLPVLEQAICRAIEDSETEAGLG